uniref:Uncharacterized protein n=1 Tax=Arundo donax TaxID=35708 RepID=A0A0A8ZMC2_ARUDO
MSCRARLSSFSSRARRWAWAPRRWWRPAPWTKSRPSSGSTSP